MRKIYYDHRQPKNIHLLLDMTNIFIWVSIYYRFQPGNIIKNKEINI